jgi:hypothetical protein
MLVMIKVDRFKGFKGPAAVCDEPGEVAVDVEEINDCAMADGGG